MVEVFSANPARIFGLRNKGALAPGFDADLVIFDPDKEVTLTARTLHMNCDYNPYEGVRVVGNPVVTISRGRIVCQSGEFRGDFGHGRMVRRGR
jgi:dihydropyrimidinase